VNDPNLSSPGTQILGAFASLVGLLGIFLYFTGWIYRWAYFGWFRVEIDRLDLPVRSFLFVPIQVFCGDVPAFIRTLLAMILAALAIKLTLWLLHPLSIDRPYRRWNKFTGKIYRYFAPVRFVTRVIPDSLRQDSIVVLWLLIALFWLSRFQGSIDARRDAVNDTSTLSVITLILSDKLAIGRNPEDVFTDPSLKEYRMIGEPKLLDDLRGKESNDSEIDPPRVWRLLIQNNNWTYLFRALPPNAADDERPAIVAIRERSEDLEGQVMIVAPDIPRSK
jgi:hypothetical protein